MRGSCHFLVKSLRISGKQSGPIILHSQDFCPSRQDTDGWGEKNTDCYKRLFRVFFWTKCENSHTTLLEKTYSSCFKYFFFKLTVPFLKETSTLNPHVIRQMSVSLLWLRWDGRLPRPAPLLLPLHPTAPLGGLGTPGIAFSD